MKMISSVESIPREVFEKELNPLVGDILTTILGGINWTVYCSIMNSVEIRKI